MRIYFSTIGEDSHRIEENTSKDLILGGVKFNEDFSMKANSDGDVILHALTNAISGATTYNVLGKVADTMCKNGITDSKEYLKEALTKLDDIKIEHVSISIESLRPKFSPKIDEIRTSISKLLNIKEKHIGITATTGEGLTECGKGNGIFVKVLLSLSRPKEKDE